MAQIRFVCAALVVAIASFAHAQESTNPTPTSVDTYELDLFGLAEQETSALATFAWDESAAWLQSGDFRFDTASLNYTGSWFGFSWGALNFRFALGSTSEEGSLLMKSLSWGDMLIGRALEFGPESYSHYFVIGSILDSSAADDSIGEMGEVDVPGGAATAEEATNDETMEGEQAEDPAGNGDASLTVVESLIAE